MANNTNQVLVPNAREALNRFKMESATEVGVNLKQGYNGDLTTKQAGSIGGQMVKKMTPVRSLHYTRADRKAIGHCQRITYLASVVFS